MLAWLLPKSVFVLVSESQRARQQRRSAPLELMRALPSKDLRRQSLLPDSLRASTDRDQKKALAEAGPSHSTGAVPAAKPFPLTKSGALAKKRLRDLPAAASTDTALQMVKLATVEGVQEEPFQRRGALVDDKESDVK